MIYVYATAYDDRPWPRICNDILLWVDISRKTGATSSRGSHSNTYEDRGLKGKSWGVEWTGVKGHDGPHNEAKRLKQETMP